MSKKNTNTDGRGHSGSGSRQRASKKSNNSSNDSVESFLASDTLQNWTFGASRSSTNTNASGINWTNLVRNGGLAAAAATATATTTTNNNNNIITGNNNNNGAATSTNQDNDNDSDSDNHVDHYAIGEKHGLKFVAVSTRNNATGISPLLITTNPCGNDNGGLPNVIAAVSSIRDLFPLNGNANFFATNLDTIRKPQPGVSHVVKPNLSYIRTNDGGIPPERLYYQQQDVDQDETILINGKEFVIPAGSALEYCDEEIVSLKCDNDLKSKYYSQQQRQSTTLVALKDNGTTNYEVLAVLPCSRLVDPVLGKSKKHAVNKTFKGITYFDGDELETVDVKFVKYQAEHGDVGRVSVLGTKILKRRYLVLPSYEGKARDKIMKDWKKESAKHRVGILEEIGISQEARDKIYQNLVKLEDSLEDIVCPKMHWLKPGSL